MRNIYSKYYIGKMNMRLFLYTLYKIGCKGHNIKTRKNLSGIKNVFKYLICYMGKARPVYLYSMFHNTKASQTFLKKVENVFQQENS